MRSTFARSRNRRLVALLCGFALALCGGAEPEEAGALVERLQQRYDGVRDLRARFVQSSLVASLGREEVSRGVVMVQRPGRMRWEYQQPEPSVLLIDGSAVHLYSPGEAKLQIAPLEEGTVSPTALGFLLGGSRLDQTFRAERLAPDERGEPGLRLVPREDAGFEALELRLDADSLELRESLLVDLFGNRTRVRFEGVAENAGLPDDAFELEVPDGTQVIDLRR